MRGDERATDVRSSAPTGRWRSGRQVGRTIYLDEVLVGVMDTPELAARVVAALNAEEAASE